MTTKPLTHKEAVDLFAPWGGDRPVALAVSGGPDSMALVWAVREAGLKTVAFIVDHGLRAESSVEAKMVQQRLDVMGIKAEILRWEHGVVASRIHVEARKARYRLLTEACKRRGIDTLLLAHHRDDQAETILMRLAKGSGLAGLAGMLQENEKEGIRLIRPFLSVPKARLIATCEANNISFVVDPSNESERYARGRLRRVGEVLAAEGLTTMRLLDLGERAGEAAASVDFYAKAFMREHVALTVGGAVEMAPELFASLPRAVALRVLDLALRTLHPSDYAPERTGLLGLWKYLVGNSDAAAHTLQGCIVQKGQRQVRFIREIAAIQAAIPLVPEQTVLWDSRWLVSLATGTEGGTVKALGLQSRNVLDRLDPSFYHLIPQGRVRAACPALWQGEKLVALPSVGGSVASLLCVRHISPLWLQ